jgi:phage shock protein A
MIEDEIKRTKDLLSRWEHRAHLAVEKDRDDLAREALIEKNRVLHRLATLEEELIQMQSIIDSMQEQIVKLEGKREEVRDKQRMLVQRAYHAQEKKKVVETLREIDAVASCRRFAELEEKIERMEADAEMAGFNSATQTKEKQFAQMETDEEIEAELAKMKASKSKKKES